jgi:hypothetical protein
MNGSFPQSESSRKNRGFLDGSLYFPWLKFLIFPIWVKPIAMYVFSVSRVSLQSKGTRETLEMGFRNQVRALP